MGSSGKKKTTMAKLARESRLRERRLLKQAKKSDRKTALADRRDRHADTLSDTISASSPTAPAQPAPEDVAQPPSNAW
jgi:hypothetical protein